MNRRLDLAYLYLNAGEIYEQFKTLLKNRCPDFNDFKEVDYSSNQGTQYFVELLNILKQTSNPDLKNKRNRQQLLTMIEIAALLNDSLLVQNTFKIIDKYYQDDFDKETYFNDLYAPDGAYMLYQLFSGARCIGYENSEFCRFWFNEYDSFIKQIYNYNIYQDTDHHKLYKIIENDPIKISLYTYIIPDLCLQTLSNAPWNTMPVLERDKIYNYTSRIILMANTGHYRLDIILLSLVYNYDHLGYLGVILGEMRKTEQGGLKQLSPLNNSLSAYMLSNCIESKN
ncbi:MAG: hypothetical protein JXB49_01005 [Bacteroidales bacterium]|nr:hypothetical protein [Bacteroidales bacterium]